MTERIIFVTRKAKDILYNKHLEKYYIFFFSQRSEPVNTGKMEEFVPTIKVIVPNFLFISFQLDSNRSDISYALMYIYIYIYQAF